MGIYKFYKYKQQINNMDEEDSPEKTQPPVPQEQPQ